MTNSLVSLIFAAIMAGTSYFTIGIAGAMIIGLTCFFLMLILTTFSHFSGIKISKSSSAQRMKKQALASAASQLQYE